MMLEQSSDPDTLSNRVVHVSVQLFSNESLAFRMAEHLNLLHVMVISLKYMMSKILTQNTLHGMYIHGVMVLLFGIYGTTVVFLLNKK
jgi:E3 ubiquitin-protein ligase UBR3